jgi:hypothetical protein
VEDAHERGLEFGFRNSIAHAGFDGGVLLDRSIGSFHCCAHHSRSHPNYANAKCLQRWLSQAVRRPA